MYPNSTLVLHILLYLFYATLLFYQSSFFVYSKLFLLLLPQLLLLLLDRFHLNPELKKHPQYAPFGIGVRICAGRNLANVELRLVAAHFFHNFAVHTVGGRPVDIVEGIYSLFSLYYPLSFILVLIHLLQSTI